MPRITREPGHYGTEINVWHGGDADADFAAHSLSGGLCAGVSRRLPTRPHDFPHLVINLNDTIRGETAGFRSFRLKVEQAFLHYRHPTVEMGGTHFTALLAHLRDVVGEVSDQHLCEALIANALQSARAFDSSILRRGINLRAELFEDGREVFSTASPFEQRVRFHFVTHQDIVLMFFARYWCDWTISQPLSLADWDCFISHLADSGFLWSAFSAGANLGRQRGRRLPAWYSVGEPLPTVPARRWELEPDHLTMGFEIEVDFFDSSSQHPRRDVANALERLGWSAYSGEYADRTNGLLFGVRPDGSTHSEVCSPIFSISTFEGFALAADAIRDVCRALVECGGGVRRVDSRSGFHLHFGRGSFSTRTRRNSRSLVVDDEAMARFLSATVGEGWANWAGLQPPSRRANHYAQRSQCFYGTDQLDYDTARWFNFFIDGQLLNAGGHTCAVDSETQAWGTCEVRLGASAVLSPDKLIGWLGVNRALYLRSVNDNLLDYCADERLSDWVKRLMRGEPGRDEAVALARLRQEVI